LIALLILGLVKPSTFTKAPEHEHEQYGRTAIRISHIYVPYAKQSTMLQVALIYVFIEIQHGYLHGLQLGILSNFQSSLIIFVVLIPQY
jgi:hypothetical protein